MRRRGPTAALVVFAVYLLALGAFTALGFYRAGQAQRSQCEALDRFAMNLGHELQADEAQIERFLDQLHDDLDNC